MARYKIEFARSVRKDLKKIPKQDVLRILATIDGLESEPRPVSCKKLTGKDLFRLRVGNYRVIYEILDDKLVVLVVKIGDRKNVYRG